MQLRSTRRGSSRGLKIGLASLMCALAPIRTYGQGGSVGNRPALAPGDLAVLDFSSWNLGPVAPGAHGPLFVDGALAVVNHQNQRMLRANSRSTVVLSLPMALPRDFTVELDLVPKQCCQPEDVAVEGTAAINQGPSSANVVWWHGAIRVIGGGETFDRPMPDAIAAALPGALTNVMISFRGDELTVYTNGQLIYTIPNTLFARGLRSAVLRVFLGGQNDTDQAVYLARFRVTAGAQTPVAALPIVSPAVTAPIAATASVTAAISSPSASSSTISPTPVALTRTLPAGSRVSSLTPANCGLFTTVTASATSNTSARITWGGISSTCRMLAQAQGETLNGYVLLRWRTVDGNPCPATFDDWAAAGTFFGGTLDSRCHDHSLWMNYGKVDDYGLEVGQTYSYRLWAFFEHSCYRLMTCTSDNPPVRGYPPVDLTVTLPGPAAPGRLPRVTIAPPKLFLQATVQKNTYFDSWSGMSTQGVFYAWAPTAMAQSYVLSFDSEDSYGSDVWWVEVETAVIPASSNPTHTLMLPMGRPARACIAIITDPAALPDPRQGECIRTNLP